MQGTAPQLIAAIRKGNQEAFRQFFEDHHREIYVFALRFLKSGDRAEELCQDVFIKFWNYRTQLDAEKNIKAYLYKIAQRTIFDELRREARDKKMKASIFAMQTDKYEPVEHGVFYKELLQIYEDAINLLPSQRKKVFQMSRIDNLSHEEIAKIMAISKNTVKDQVVKASRFIRKYVRIRH